MSINLPTLSSAGFVQDPAVILDRLLAYFFVADFSQTNQHRGRVQSLPYLIKNHGSEPDILVDRIETAMNTLLSAYFDTVDVTVTLTDVLDTKPQYDIQLEGTVSRDGSRYSLGRLLSIANNTLKQVSELQVK